VSFLISCETQDEIDSLWDKLSEGGEPLRCGWVTDKFGLTWQVVPQALGNLLGDPDPIKAGNVMKEMPKMIKLDLPALQRAYDQA